MELFYFTAPWCVPCRSFGPIMDEISKDNAVTKINVDESTLPTEMGVFSVPTVILFKDKVEQGRFSGSRDQKFVERFISSHA